jgi:hypothetical protein
VARIQAPVAQQAMKAVHVPDELLRQLKIRAAETGQTLRALVEAAITQLRYEHPDRITIGYSANLKKYRAVKQRGNMPKLTAVGPSKEEVVGALILKTPESFGISIEDFSLGPLGKQETPR